MSGKPTEERARETADQLEDYVCDLSHPDDLQWSTPFAREVILSALRAEREQAEREAMEKACAAVCQCCRWKDETLPHHQACKDLRRAFRGDGPGE